MFFFSDKPFPPQQMKDEPPITFDFFFNYIFDYYLIIKNTYIS